MPYICLARNDIPDGTLQILDLKPNESQRNWSNDPPGQTRYVNRVEADQVYVGTGDVVLHEAKGLIAYLVDRVDPEATAGWTLANQLTIANALIARVDAGQSMTLSDINTVLQATLAGVDLDGAGADSTGTVADVLSIMAGRRYVIPAGATKGIAGTWAATQAGSFTEAVTVINDSGVPVTQNYEYRGIRNTYDSTALQLSILGGDLFELSSGFTLFPDSARTGGTPLGEFQSAATYTTVSSARVVTVYDDSGNVLV